PCPALERFLRFCNSHASQKATCHENQKTAHKSSKSSRVSSMSPASTIIPQMTNPSRNSAASNQFRRESVSSRATATTQRTVKPKPRTETTSGHEMPNAKPRSRSRKPMTNPSNESRARMQGNLEEFRESSTHCTAFPPSQTLFGDA